MPDTIREPTLPASTTHAGIVTLAEDGESSDDPLQSDDSRIPTAAQKAALAGTSGTPGTGNKYVTDSDPRLLASSASATPAPDTIPVSDTSGTLDSWISHASSSVWGLLKLGVAGGAQAFNALLNSMSNLETSGFIVRKADGTSVTRSLVSGPGVQVTNGTGQDGNVTFSLTGGSNSDRNAAMGYTLDVYPQKTSAIMDNGTPSQSGTAALVNDSAGRRRLRKTGSPSSIYTSGLDTYVVGSIVGVATFTIATNSTDLTGNVYKFGLCGANTFTSALSDSIQHICIGYRNLSSANWYILTGTAAAQTALDTGVPVSVNTIYKLVLSTYVGSVTAEIYSWSGSAWTSLYTGTVTTTMPGTGAALGLATFSTTTSGTNEWFLYGANFKLGFGW